jgi:hypothetical protein
VVLMEVHPEEQKTRPDFLLTEKLLGIRTVCITKIRKQGRRLFYEEAGKQIPIKRIYNRTIVDELERKGVSCPSISATISTSSGQGIPTGISA